MPATARIVRVRDVFAATSRIYVLHAAALRRKDVRRSCSSPRDTGVASAHMKKRATRRPPFLCLCVASCLQPGCRLEHCGLVCPLVSSHIASRYEHRPTGRYRAVARRPYRPAAALRAAALWLRPALCALTSLREVSLRRKSQSSLRDRGAYSPAAARSVWALSVRSQVNSGSSRPKCPYAAVFS